MRQIDIINGESVKIQGTKSSIMIEQIYDRFKVHITNKKGIIEAIWI
jgi:hypothetical protein